MNDVDVAAMRDADATRLHADGCLPLSERPHWALCDFAERMQAEWHEFIVDWLEKRRAEWFGGDGGMHGAHGAWLVAVSSHA